MAQLNIATASRAPVTYLKLFISRLFDGPWRLWIVKPLLVKVTNEQPQYYQAIEAPPLSPSLPPAPDPGPATDPAN